MQGPDYPELARRLAVSLDALMKRMERNEICRNTVMDHQPDWTMRMVEFVTELKNAQAALDDARNLRLLPPEG